MAISEEQVLEQLKQVIDPELFVNIVDLGLIYTVEIGGSGGEASTEADKTETEPSDGAASQPQAGGETEAAGEEAQASGEEAAAAGEESQASGAEAAAAGDEAEAAGEDAEAAGDGVPVKIEMTMTSPMCPAGPQLVANSKQVVSRIPGVGEVEVRVVMDPPWTPDRMTEDAKDQLGIF